MSIIKTQTDGPALAIYGPDPFEAYANAVAPRTIIGTLLRFSKGDYSYCVTNFGVCCEQRSMGNARASLRERPPISVASLQSSLERGVQAATADPLGW
jgi:hypothetical protein